MKPYININSHSSIPTSGSRFSKTSRCNSTVIVTQLFHVDCFYFCRNTENSITEETPLNINMNSYQFNYKLFPVALCRYMCVRSVHIQILDVSSCFAQSKSHRRYYGYLLDTAFNKSPGYHREIKWKITRLFPTKIWEKNNMRMTPIRVIFRFYN